MRVRFWGTRGSIATPGPGTNHFGGNTSCVELTTAGRHALERADKARETLEEEVLAALSPEERATLRRLMQRVLDGLLQPSPSGAGAPH